VRCLAYVHLRGFYVAVLAPKEGEILVLHRDKAVLDASAAARGRGVRVGMGLAEAKAILAGGGRLREWEEELFHEAMARWLEVVADYSDAVEPVDQHAAFVDLSLHPRPRELAERMRAALVEHGVSPQVGIAHSRWIAQHAALAGDPLGLAAADPRGFVAGLPTAALPVPRDHARRLVALGYPAVGDVAGIDLETLRRQFGEEAHEIHRAAGGGGDSLVQAAFPPDALSARFAYGGPPETTEALEAGFRALAREIAAALSERDAVGERAELFLEHADGSVTRVRRTFSKPVATAMHALSAMRLMLPHPPEKPVEAARLRLPEIRRARRVQLGLQGERSRADSRASTEAAVDHVRAVFGDGAIRLGSEVAEPRWKKVRRAWSAANGWVW
jgi:nucleotidyltransferase/DNA polymerase involved in DNA repair